MNLASCITWPLPNHLACSLLFTDSKKDRLPWIVPSRLGKRNFANHRRLNPNAPKAREDRAARWKFAWQLSPLAACPQKVKDDVEDGMEVGGERSRSRQNRGNPGPRRVGQFGVAESSAHRTVPFGPDERSFKKDNNFSNTLLAEDQ
jgi:hypothetical protein